MSEISSSGKQRVEFFRKVRLREKLLKLHPDSKNPVAYVPFIGDGDLAVQHYSRFKVYGADLDPARTAIARTRVTDRSVITTSDCDIWPFEAIPDVFTVADFDAYCHPYRSFRAFWVNARKANRMILFFTDGNLQAIFRTATGEHPSGEKLHPKDIREKRLLGNFWFKKHVLPWFSDYVRPYRIVKKSLYRRSMMVYWGAVIEK